MERKKIDAKVKGDKDAKVEGYAKAKRKGEFSIGGIHIGGKG